MSLNLTPCMAGKIIMATSRNCNGEKRSGFGLAMTLALLLICIDPGGRHAFAADALVAGDARRSVLEDRLSQIELDQKASASRYADDKKACARKILVSRCTTEALAGRRARDDALTQAGTAARADLRGLAQVEKNRSLAASMPGDQRDRSEADKRREAQSARAGKLADVQERRRGHEQKKAQAAENRASWEAKQARAQERLRDNEARKLDAGKAASARGAGAPRPVAGYPLPAPAAAGLKASAN